MGQIISNMQQTKKNKKNQFLDFRVLLGFSVYYFLHSLFNIYKVLITLFSKPSTILTEPKDFGNKTGMTMITLIKIWK